MRMLSDLLNTATPDSEAGHNLRMSRRGLLIRAGIVGASVIAGPTLLAACGSDDAATTAPGAGSTTAPSGDAATSAPDATTATGATDTTPATSTEGEGTPGGKLTLALNSDLTTMDPHKSTAAVDRQVYQLIYDKLVEIDETLNIVPELATSWEISTDGTEYVFTLVDGVMFHDGEPFNAAAAKANFDRIFDDATASPRKSEIQQITEVEAVDDTTLKLTLSQAFSPLLATLSDRAGMMISPKAITDFGDDLARNPVGTGAFTFVEWIKDDHLTVKKTADWWQPGLPYLDEVIYKPITDASVRLTALRTNDVQMMDQISAKDVQQTKADSSLVYSEVAGLGFTYITMNAMVAPFDVMELRQAVAWCIDREAINQALFFGTGAPAQTPIPPSSWAYDDGVQVYQQDYDKAREMLAAGGKPDGFSFTMLVTNTPDASQLAEAYKAQLSEVGIVANLELLEFGTLLDRSNASNFESISLGWSGRPDPDGNIYSYFHTDGGLNRGGYSNAEVDRLLEETRMKATPEERKPIYSEVTKLIAEEAPMVFVRFPAEIKVAQPTVKGFVHVPDGMMRMDKVWIEQG